MPSAAIFLQAASVACSSTTQQLVLELYSASSTRAPTRPPSSSLTQAALTLRSVPMPVHLTYPQLPNLKRAWRTDIRPAWQHVADCEAQQGDETLRGFEPPSELTFSTKSTLLDAHSHICIELLDHLVPLLERPPSLWSSLLLAGMVQPSCTRTAR